MDEMRMFAQLDKENQERVLTLMRAFASKDQNRISWAWLVCRLAADAKGNARKVALMYVEDGLEMREIARKMGFSERWCYKLYHKAMEQVNAS